MIPLLIFYFKLEADNLNSHYCCWVGGGRRAHP